MVETLDRWQRLSDPWSDGYADARSSGIEECYIGVGRGA
jgi:hypothetical protein